MTQNDPNKIVNSTPQDSEKQRAKRRGWFWLLLLIILLAIIFGWHNYKENNGTNNPADAQQSSESQNTSNPTDTSTNADKTEGSSAGLNSSSTPSQDSGSPATEQAPGTESSTSTDPAPAEDNSAGDDETNPDTESTGAANSDQTAAASSDSDQSTSAKDSEASPTVITTESQAALAKLDTYFKNDSGKESDWIDLDDVSFAVGSAVPEFNSEKLKRVAELLAAHSNNHFLIHGFTDSTGPADLNKNLSTERANKISQFLVDNGVKSEQISVEGQGAKAAVADNDTKDGRDKNRRVAIKVLAAK